jgi:two-component system OmpR family response regulator
MTVGGTARETTPEARVLIVDDEDNIVELLSVSLKFQGFEVYAATNGPAALDRARETRPDAVILDVMMPGMDGFGVLRRLRADGVDAPALFLTARDSLQDKITGQAHGGDVTVTTAPGQGCRFYVALPRITDLPAHVSSASGQLSERGLDLCLCLVQRFR